MTALYSFAQEREIERMKIQARMMGAEFEEDKKTKRTTASPKTRVQGDSNYTLFKHPKEYAHMSGSERQKLTEQMLGVHRQKMRNTPLGR